MLYYELKITAANGFRLQKIQNGVQFCSCSLSNLHLTELDEALMQKLINLETLNLSQNQLTSIPSDLKLDKLKKLDISQNNLTDLDFLSQFSALQEVFVEGNKHDVSLKFPTV